MFGYSCLIYELFFFFFTKKLNDSEFFEGLFKTNYKISISIQNERTLAILSGECDDGQGHIHQMNELILSLLNDLDAKCQEDVLDSFYQIAFLSSESFEQNSIFLNSSFHIQLLNHLFELEIRPIFIILHNIIADSYFNLELFNVIRESDYINFFLDNFQEDEYFLRMLNMLIYKTYSFDHEFLLIFHNSIPFLINGINFDLGKERFYAINSLCYLLTTPECMNFALENELIKVLINSLSLSNTRIFCQSLILINLIYKYDKSVYNPDDNIVSLIFHHLEYIDDQQIKIIIDYFKFLITVDSQSFFELDIINNLLATISTCSYKKKKEIVFFFAQSFSIISDRYSQFLEHQFIDDSDIVFNNAMLHNIISSIMETCLDFDEEKCLFCLDIISYYFESYYDDSILAAEEVSFPQTLLDIANKDDWSKNASIFAKIEEISQYLFHNYIECDEEDQNFD